MSEINREETLRSLLPYSATSLFKNPSIQSLFQKMSSDEYVLMWLFSKYTKDTGNEKIYLKNIAKRLNLPMHKVSKIVRRLQEKDFVRWTHDGIGEEGTYIQLTDTSITSAQEQKQLLWQYDQRVVEAYGEEAFIHLLGEISRLEEIMRIEAEKVGESIEHSEP
ncbi:hypothetical protein [Evtepia sp.]|uniref:hypothetical protein n=1 Tax=Evtepia sp. TaxID=2773933 RepID=UPI002A74E83D|nr:hypothetical protein [Evtepia sp.]